jgi:hypothetical protein
MREGVVARVERQCYQGLNEPVERALSFPFGVTLGGELIL